MDDDLTVAHDLVVYMDYGQFTLHGGQSAVEDADPTDLLDVALDGAGVAGDGHTVLVVSPHQNNFSMGLRIEVWRHEPDDDLDRWSEAFEAPVEVEADGELWYGSPTVTGTACAVPPGRYHARITGRDFVARGWPGSTRPGDSWRVQLWPATGDVPVRRLRSWTPR